MTECPVYQIILFRVTVAIFIEYDPDGGGALFSFAGKGGAAPPCGVEKVPGSPFRQLRCAGGKLLGTIQRDRIGEAWRLCQAYADDRDRRHADVTEWCVAAGEMLARHGLVVARPWWTLPTIAEND